MVAAPPAAAAAMRRGFLVPEIRPLDQYDGARARSAASLAWAIATGYGGADKVPEELREPFYTDQYEQEHLKPPVARVLLGSDLYLRAWGQALGPPAPPDTPGLLDALRRRGLAPSLHQQPLREEHLRHRPILLAAHLALIDSLMAAFIAEATRGLGPPPGAPPGSNSWEQKILGWLDTVNRKLQEHTEREGAPPDGSAAPPACSHKHAIAFCLKESGNKPAVIRYRKDKAPPRPSPVFPPVMGLKDLANGGALGAAIHYYCPQALRLDELCLQEPLSVAEALHNLGLVREFSRRHLGTRCPLALEDLLYMDPALRLNVGAFLAELFLCFEVLRPPFVRPRDLGGALEAPAAGDAPAPKSSSPGFNFRHPLLSGGQSPPPLQGTPGPLPHSPSLPHGDGGFGKAWGKNPLSHPLSQAVSFSIPFGLDSDVDIVMGNPVGAALARSASSDSLAAPPRRPALPPKASSPPPRRPALPNGLAEPHDLPTIEEALQIIHSSERLLPEGAPDAFYLHSPDLKEPPVDLGDSPKPLREPPKELGDAPKDLREPRKDLGDAPKDLRDAPKDLGDSPKYLRDPRKDPGEPRKDLRDAPKGLRDAFKDLGDPPVDLGDPPDLRPPPDSSSNPQGRTMTSFAERKKKLEEASGGGGGGGGSGGSAPPGGSPKRREGPGEGGEGLSAEMSQLGARLEEKRRAIEAQKKRIEAIFAKHRQRLGKSAFLQLKREEDVVEEEEGAGGSGGKKQVTFAPQEPPGHYEAAMAKLSTALNTLQLDMQRLSQQQERLLQDQRPPSGQAWVIPVPKSSRGAAAPPKAPSSPSPARKAGAPPPRKAPRSPRRARPAELRLPTLTRVLTPPTDVDTLPHLRKFSPSQVPVQTRSSIHFSEEEDEEEEPRPPPPPPESPEAPEMEARGNLRPGGSTRVSGDGTSDVSSPGERRASLLEVPLENLRPEEDEEDEEDEEEGEGDSLEGSPTEAGAGGETRGSLGFFFEVPQEDTQRREGLLQRQQQQRRLWGGERPEGGAPAR
ncbi:LOW QUALITY PROTEIN: calmodulin-regulated spectrin-associated protein 3-like [Phaenicophaeus curvirostris]|uniref:LOW QUALITY PROTEIN: calmodulin-regulated spectrin-associated protein 3-like n=1 Tax=Phaenicophaeus curvirostris TaxID=33595 RepID=UPI0037F0C6F1